MFNAITKGSRLLSQFFSNQKSQEDLILNEDWVVVGKIVSYSPTTGAAEFYKAWDTEETKVFKGKIVYAGRDGIPESEEVEEDSYLPFYRVGDFNSTGTTSPELHTENASNFSWIGFVGKQE